MTRGLVHRWHALALLLGLIAPFLASLPAHAQSNPFTGAPVAREAPAETVSTGLWTRVGREVVRIQREMNLRLAQQMRSIRNGGNATALISALALAFLYGAFHVAGPGHGKAVIISYFLGRQASLMRGLLLGTQIAITHVIAAIVLVWVADIVLRQSLGTAPTEMRWVQALSYGTILAVGLHMLWQGVRHWRSGIAASCGHMACSHDHSHHHHVHGNADPHGRIDEDGRGRAQQGLLSFAIGLVPCTGATLVMLYALANDILLAGILMVVAIGIGMAITMALIGVLTISARRMLVGRNTATATSSRLATILRLSAGLLIAAIASIMLYGAMFHGSAASV